jgi:hypothetical protein
MAPSVADPEEVMSGTIASVADPEEVMSGTMDPDEVMSGISVTWTTV